MELSARSYLTAGVAVIGVGAIALSPVQPLPDRTALLPERVVSGLAVDLASTIDPITPWVDTFKTAAANFQNLVKFYLQQPLPLIQTIGANIGTYLKELPDVSLIASQIASNVQTFFKAPWSPGDPVGEYISPVPVTTIPVLDVPLSQQSVFALLPAVLGQDTYTKLEPIINWTATPYSAEITGLLGTLLAPLVQLTRSFTAIGQYVQGGDVTGAINELINIPANVTNAVLNGAGFLDLTAVANSIAPLPPEVTSLGLNLGGVLNAVPASGTLETPETWSGGTAFDGLAATISYKISDFPRPDGTSVTVNDPGIPVGWWGSVIGLGQFLGDQLLVTPPAPPAQAVRSARTAVTAASRSARLARAEALAEAAAAPAGADATATAAVAADSSAANTADAAPAAAVKAPKTKRNRAAANRPARGPAKASAARHAG